MLNVITETAGEQQQAKRVTRHQRPWADVAISDICRKRRLVEEFRHDLYIGNFRLVFRSSFVFCF